MVTTLVGPFPRPRLAILSIAPQPLIWAPSLPESLFIMLALSCGDAEGGKLGIFCAAKVERLARDRAGPTAGCENRTQLKRGPTGLRSGAGRSPA